MKNILTLVFVVVIHRFMLYNIYFLTTKKDLLFSAIAVTNYQSEVGDVERSAVKKYCLRRPTSFPGFSPTRPTERGRDG